jgi:hypothetical protein
VITWEGTKQVFFAIGSAAGVFAFLRPWIESKVSRDQQRIDYVKSLINEQQLVDLEASIYQSRSVYSEHFEPFDRLTHERRTNQDRVRFTGPMSDYLTAQLDDLLAAYRRLRKYVQVPEWEPKRYMYEGEETRSWDFNREAFRQADGVPRDYTTHLDEAAQQAEDMKNAFYRFQIVSETHVFEMPFAKWVIPHRFKTHDLLPSK